MLEAETHRNKEVIWLLGGLTPDHWTISNYRKEQADDIKFVTKKFRKFLKDSGYIKLKTVAIDGSKVKAYTNRDMLTVEKIDAKLEAIDKKIEDYLSKIAQSDRRDEVIDELESSDQPGEISKYLDKIVQLQKQVEQLQKHKETLEKEGRKYISPADPEARLMKSRDGKIPAYNVQIAVDAENKMIADSEVVTDETDLKMLPVMIESIKEELGEVPEEAIGDRGYNNPDLIEVMEKKKSAEGEGIKIYTSQEKTIRDKEEIKFNYDEEKDEYECSEGKRLVLSARNKKRRNSIANVYQGIECEGCSLREKCTRSKKGRILHRYINQKWRDEYKAKMQSKLGKEKTAVRKTIVEHPFGTIKYLIINYLKNRLKDNPPVAIAHAVCFPDDFDSSDHTAKQHSDITIAGESVDYLYIAVTNILRDHKKPDYKIDSLMFKYLMNYLLPIFEYGTSIADKIGQEKRKVFSLTEQQCEFLIFISEHKKALVKGCAGSGKTVMAVKKAKLLASQGKDVLLLCYNVMLSENLALETKDYPNIITKTYHNFCGEELDNAGLETRPAETKQDFFQREMPEKFMELLESHPIKFDAVIVDEGQDFKEDYWITISELVKDDGYFYVFYDPDQNIFGSELKFPDLGEPFILNKNCRNTKKIFTELKQLASMELRISDEAPEGSEIIKFELHSNSEVRNKLSQIVHDLISNQNLKENQIAILGTHKLAHTSIGENCQVGKFTIVENGMADTNKIPYYTCMKYKGLEADVIIILDYHDGRWHNPATRYTAISRAKHLLYILAYNN